MHTKIKTMPDLSLSSPAHQHALLNKEEAFWSWQYNVEDRFKSMTTEQIRQSLKETAHPFAMLFEQILGEFNFGTGVRNCNAFNAREVFYLGNRKWDKRSALGVQNYTDVKWLSTIDELLKLKDQYKFVAVDNTPGSISIADFKFEPNTLFCFGEEGPGLTPTIQGLCETKIHIPQYGSVRSINVGTASGIIAHEFVSRYNKGDCK